MNIDDRTMPHVIRRGLPADAEPLMRLDHVAQIDPRRGERIWGSLRHNACWVAVEADRHLGYAIQGEFFEFDFLQLVYVGEASRRTGIGRPLINAVEQACRSAKLFTSTNASTVAMRKLLGQLSYEPAGVIQHLDPGDPELFFYKPVTPLTDESITI